MQIEHSEEDRAFAHEIVAFLDQRLPPEQRYRYNSMEHSEKETMLWWHGELASQGWLTPAWPKEYGGPGWSETQRHIFKRECELAGAPATSIFGPVMVGPVIYTFGNQTQKKRFLPGILSGNELWCQGYSEPGSGSDLASLKTRADDRGDHYLVNGQKTWTTQAHWADWMFCLVRTDWDSKPQAGISFVLIDMKSPGIEVRPIVSIDGLHHLNEVYFTDVQVPKEYRIGEENEGWTYAKFLLKNERGAVAYTAETRARLDRLRLMASTQTSYSEPLITNPSFASRLSDLEMRLTALEVTEARALTSDPESAQAARLAMPLKTIGTQLQQDVNDLSVELVGYAAIPREDIDQSLSESNAPPPFQEASRLVESQLFGRASTIYGGTSEVQKNIMAKVLLSA